MANPNKVQANEEHQMIVEDGDMTYFCYPDYGVTSETEEKWAVKRIDESTPTKTIWKWAGGTKDKVHAVNDLSALTFTFLK